MKKAIISVLITVGISILVIVGLVFAVIRLTADIQNDKDDESESYFDTVSSDIPDTDLKEEKKQFTVSVSENREGEPVFDFTIDEYIEEFNSYYIKDKGSAYLSPSVKWREQILDNAVHSDYETKYCLFSEDEKIWALPTVAVYVPTNKECVEEISVNFDWHSYSDNMYDLYKELCNYTVKVFFPDMPDNTVEEFVSTVIDFGQEYPFSVDEWYQHGSMPKAVFCQGNIGIYPYFALGSWQNFCIIPIDDNTVENFIEKGVEIKNID